VIVAGCEIPATAEQGGGAWPKGNDAERRSAMLRAAGTPLTVRLALGLPAGLGTALSCPPRSG
jgi:hypothetical protein